jgi:hypothetical protein
MVHEVIYGPLCGIMLIYQLFDERFCNKEWKKSGITIQLAKKDITDRKKVGRKPVPKLFSYFLTVCERILFPSPLSLPLIQSNILLLLQQ